MNYFKEFEAVATKLNELLAENMLTYKFSTAAFPITLTIMPDASMDAQMSMYEQAEDGVSSNDAKLVYSFKVGEIAVRVYGRIIMPDALMSKIKGLAKKMHYVWLQCYFAESISTDTPKGAAVAEVADDTEPEDDFSGFYEDEEVSAELIDADEDEDLDEYNEDEE